MGGIAQEAPGFRHAAPEKTGRPRETQHIDTAEFTADKGCESREDIEKRVLDGIMPDVGFRYDREERVLNLGHIPANITPAI